MLRSVGTNTSYTVRMSSMKQERSNIHWFVVSHHVTTMKDSENDEGRWAVLQLFLSFFIVPIQIERLVLYRKPRESLQNSVL